MAEVKEMRRDTRQMPWVRVQMLGARDAAEWIPFESDRLAPSGKRAGVMMHPYVRRACVRVRVRTCVPWCACACVSVCAVARTYHHRHASNQPTNQPTNDRYTAGAMVDALDKFTDKYGILQRTWRLATVLAVDCTRIKVHYEGWSSRWDTWIDVTTEEGQQRVAKAFRHTGKPTDVGTLKKVQDESFRQKLEEVGCCGSMSGRVWVETSGVTKRKTTK